MSHIIFLHHISINKNKYVKIILYILKVIIYQSFNIHQGNKINTNG